MPWRALGTVTVLVTDLVGGRHRCAPGVGEQSADRLRREHDQLLTDVVGRRGAIGGEGTGDGILATFPWRRGCGLGRG